MIIIILYSLFLVTLLFVFTFKKNPKKRTIGRHQKISTDSFILFICSFGCMIFGILILIFDVGDLTRYINGISLIGFGTSILAMEFSSNDSDEQKEILDKILNELKQK